MEECQQIITENLVRLHNLNTSQEADQSEIESITTNISTLCEENSLSLAGFISILRTNENPMIRNYAAVLLNVCFKYQWLENPYKPDWISQLLNVLISESEDNVRENITNQISKIISGETIYIIIQFARDSVSSQNPVFLTAAISLMDSCIKYVVKRPEVTPFINNFAKAGLSLGDENSELHSFSFAFAYHSSSRDRSYGEEVEIETETDSGAIELYNAFLESITTNYGNLRYLTSACQLIAEYISYPFADVEQTLAILIGLFEDENTSAVQAESLEIALDEIAIKFPKTFAATGKLADVYNRYCLAAAASFEPDSHLADMEDFNRFSSISMAIASSTETMTQFWEIKNSLIDTSETYAGLASFYLTLAAGMKPAEAFFETALEGSPEDLIGVILQGLECESLAVRDCAEQCIISYCDVFPWYLQEHGEAIATALLRTAADSELTDELLSAMKALFHNCADTDPFFDDALSLLSSAFSASEYNNTMVSVLQCIAELAEHSQSSVSENAGEIFEFMKTIMEGEGDFVLLKGDAVRCIISLLLRCRDIFADSVGEISEFFLACMAEIDDARLVCDSINAFGYLVRLFPEQIEGVLEHAMQLLTELIGKEKHSDFIQFTQLLKLRAATNEGEVEDLEEFLSEENMGYPGAALMLYCTILTEYPQLIAENLPFVLEKASQFTDSCVSQSNDFAVRGLSILADGLCKAEINDPEVIGRIFIIIQSIAEQTGSPQNCGDALEAFAAVLGNVGAEALGVHMDTLIDILDAAIRGNLPACGDEEIPEPMRNPVRLLFREVVRAYEAEQPDMIVSIVLEKLVPMCAGNSVDAFYSFGMLAYFVGAAGLPNEETVKEVLNRIVEKAPLRIGFEPYFLISKLAEQHSETFIESAEAILNMMSQVIAGKALRSVDYLRQMDNLVSAMGKIALYVIPDAFPTELYGPALSLMPARADFDEDPSIFQFYLYLVEKMGGPTASADSLAPPLVRLFAEDPNTKAQWCFPPEEIEALRHVLIEALGAIGDAGSLCMKILGNNEQMYAYLQAELQSE